MKEIKKEHKFVGFEDDLNSKDKIVILRHDVDISMKKALKLGKIDNELGIKSTFFVMPQGKYYEIEENVDILQQILMLEHKIGLHYDSKYWSMRGLNSNQAFINEINFLKKEFNIFVKVASAHNPTINKQSVIIFPEKIINAYDPKFIKDIKYLSDSVQFWREGCICKNLKKYDKIQLLIHPEWWSQTGKKLRASIDEMWNEDNLSQVDKAELLSFYEEYLKKEKANISLS